MQATTSAYSGTALNGPGSKSRGRSGRQGQGSGQQSGASTPPASSLWLRECVEDFVLEVFLPQVGAANGNWVEAGRKGRNRDKGVVKGQNVTT